MKKACIAITALDWPWVRLNLPAGADPAEIQAEVHQMHDAGIAGIEVGQGAFPDNDRLLALLTAATQAGMKVSLSHGPTQSPAGYSIDGDHARKTMYFGKAAVDAGATFDGPLPAGAQTVVGRGGFGGAGARGGGALGSYVKAGANTITVRVATTLNNRLADLDGDVANRGVVQPYGLVGPVRLTPYSRTTIWK